MRSIGLLDLTGVPFARTPVRCLGSGGTPYTRWVPCGMPQLGGYKWILDTVFFLYPTEEAAIAGSSGSGGTGFLVSVPSRRWPNDYYHVHGVTNWHVACQGSPVIRINRCDGKPPEAFAFDCSEWIFDPKGHDAAISPPLPLEKDVHKAWALSSTLLLTAEEEQKEDINVADDVFMVGRFVDYDGVETNVPACRFGNISILHAGVENRRKNYRGRSIIIDMHSKGGFSGSPVFVYRTMGSFFPKNTEETFLVKKWHYMKLLGIHWGQFPELWQIADMASAKSVMPPAAHASLITDGKYVQGLSGMTCVAPAAAILALLNDPKLEAMREADELRQEPEMASRPIPLTPESP